MKNKTGLLLIVLINIMFFQNCDRVSSRALFSQDTASKSTNEEADSGGQPFDGKVFVLMGEVCPDGTKVRSRIVLNTPTQADLVRYECEEISPVALSSNDFQLNPENPKEMIYQNQIFVNQIVGTRLNMSLVSNEMGYCYLMHFDFGTPSNIPGAEDISKLQLYEDGKPLGPAHTDHEIIRNVGLGRFSHWKTGLWFSASDNSNPLTNGRVYSWDIKQ